MQEPRRFSTRRFEMRELISKPELCDECSRCERECPQNAIRVVSGVPVHCLHCAKDRAPCMTVCPEEAIVEIDGAIVIMEDSCIGCGLCRDSCPIGAIHLDEYGVAKKCNLCIDKETPACVLTCPKDALKVDSEDILTQKRDKIAEELSRVKLIMKY
jgi:anaerobic carbon-monoxide dehydrogenase iron sulfur subunit